MAFGRRRQHTSASATWLTPSEVPCPCSHVCQIEGCGVRCSSAVSLVCKSELSQSVFAHACIVLSWWSALASGRGWSTGGALLQLLCPVTMCKTHHHPPWRSSSADMSSTEGIRCPGLPFGSKERTLCHATQRLTSLSGWDSEASAVTIPVRDQASCCQSTSSAAQTQAC